MRRHPRRLRTTTTTLALLLAAGAVGAPAGAQEIPRTNYLRYIPLVHPRLVRQLDATARFSLYGDEHDPAYRDEAPRDGIDDARHALLQALAVRFAPYFVRNTIDVPLDFRRTLEHQNQLRLYADRWDLAGPLPELVSSETVDLADAAAAPCPAPPAVPTDTVVPLAEIAGPNDDCRLIALLDRFDPNRPHDPEVGAGAVRADDRPFTVLFLDHLGRTPEEWRRVYRDSTGHLAAPYTAMRKAYVHPFVREVARDSAGAEPRYELILQYWFYYPTNDGGNNHEGDWEHVNVVVSPRSQVTTPLAAGALRALLARAPDALDGDDPLVMRRIDYYFHQWVMPVDFGWPNAYLPRAEWRAQVRLIDARDERAGVTGLLGDIRTRVWADRGETVLNTHPIVYIGGDSKGLELLLYPPGSRNRDSHGSYPFPGFYKAIGPGSNELIRRRFKHQDYLADTTRALPEWVERFDAPARLALVPDWERIVTHLGTDARMRADWSWLVLPMRWGYPAVQSPLAGIVPHAETGNLAPVGPAFNGGWNTSGAVMSYRLYSPHRLGGFIGYSPQDAVANNFGFLNAPAVALTVLPPFDLLTKLGVAGVRGATGKAHTTYWPAAEIPPRLTGPGVGLSIQFMNGSTWFPLLQARTNVVQEPGDELFADDPLGLSLEWNFFLGRRWATEQLFRHSYVYMGITRADGNLRSSGVLDFWEYAASIRYNLRTGRVQPFVRLGYGLSWYRLDATFLGSESFGTGPWIRRPSLSKLDNLWPNTWHYGVGIEVVPLQSRARFPLGLDLGVKLDYRIYRHSLGLSVAERAQLGFEDDPGVSRGSLTLTGVISY